MTEKIRMIVSFYSDNVDKQIIDYQKEVVNKFKPKDTVFFQFHRPPNHAQNINHHLGVVDGAPKGFGDVTFLILDIDAIPLQYGVFEYIFTKAEEGRLVGIAQRSNHIENGQHIFCGAPCVAMQVSTWNKMGRPLADPTPRGDVAEEFTWKAEESGVSVDFIYPVRFKAPPIRMSWETDTRPYWPLKDDKPEHHYGRGTFYTIPGFEGDAFYHQYQSFFPGSSDMFVETAKEALK